MTDFSPEQQAAIKEAARRAVFPLLAVGRQAQSLEVTESNTRAAMAMHQDQDWEAMLVEHSPLLTNGGRTTTLGSSSPAISAEAPPEVEQDAATPATITNRGATQSPSYISGGAGGH